MLNKTHLIVFLVGILLGLCTGFFTAKALYDKPLETSVKTDTVTLWDTIPHYNPAPKDSAIIKYVTKYLPVLKTDTIMGKPITHWEYITTHDTVAVEVPITTKHYNAPEYDAWVSGFEPSLDSIKVYQKTEVITTTITQNKPPNKFSLDVVAGIDYTTTTKEYKPYAFGEFMYKPNRLEVGVRGGIEKNGEKADPFFGGVVKFKIF